MNGLYKNIENRLASISDVELIRTISAEIDGFRARFKLQKLSRTDLIKTLSIIDNYCKYSIINLKIAIRLSGGLFQCSQDLSYEDPLYLSNLLSDDKGSEQLINEFITKLDFSPDFFDKPRTFYSDRDMTLTRQRNMNNILATLDPKDTEIFIQHFEEQKRMHEVHFILSGSQFVTADFMARKIEQHFGLTKGHLDRVN